MNTDFYVKLQNPIQRANSSDLDELKVSIDHFKGGYNFAYGNYVESGIKVFFTPFHREGRCFSTTPLGDIAESGFKIHALDAKRKSQKKIDKVASAIEPLVNKFGEIWGQDNFTNTIYDMVKKALESMPK